MHKEEVYIIDTFGFLFKSYHGVPPFFNRDNFPTHLLSGFLGTIQNFKKKLNIQNVIFALEGKGKNFRNDIFPEYKANRSKAPDDFKLQLEVLLTWIKKMGFPVIEKDTFEADDVIATTAKKFEKLGFIVNIISSDKDFIQLLNENIKIIKVEKSHLIEFTPENSFAKYGVKPHQFIDYQSLVGDSTDNILGVKGVGQKTASSLLSQFENLDNIYANLSKISPAISKKLINGKDSAYLSKQLVTLVADVDIPMPEIGKIISEPTSLIIDDLIDFEMGNAVKYLMKIGEITEEYIANRDNKNFKYLSTTLNSLSAIKEVLSKIPDNSIVAFDTETTGIDTFKDKIVGFSFAYNEDGGYYVPINHDSFLLFDEEQVSEEDVKSILGEFKRFKLVGHNFKFDKHIIFNIFGIELSAYVDTMILAWLNNSTDILSLDSLSYNFLKHRKIPFKDIVKSGNTFATVDIAVATKYAVEDAVATFKLFYFFQEKMSPFFLDLGFNMETIFSENLFQMEQNGIAVDVDILHDLEVNIVKEIAIIKEEIYELANDEFNLNSPKQVAVILFDRMKIPSKKRATDEATLHAIEGNYIILDKILKYRELFKIVSTYLRPLQTRGKNSRIHTTFGQTGTITGRLNSRNPNIQNIPVKSRVRNCFVAKEGYSFLSLDYSQIELRFFAHFSKDKTMVESFQNSEDIHSVLSKQLQIKRSIAKTVNFGLLYGMGPKKLALTLDISEHEAKVISDNYFKAFSGIKKFHKDETDKIKKRGFVETILGRRRYFKFPRSLKEESANQRESLNTLFQGSSADLIKIAMMKISETINSQNLDGQLLLQIHDELIFEIKDEFLNEYAEKFQTIMENALDLEVPIVVNRKSGKNWGDMK